VSSNDSGDEPEVTKPPVPRSRPGRPASSARRATDDHAESPTGPTPRKRAPSRSAAATSVVDPALDDTVETERPEVIPPDPLLRARVAESRGNGSSRSGTSGGNGSNAGNGSNGTNGSAGTKSGTGAKPNGTARNGSAHRARSAQSTAAGPRTGDAPIEAAAVETKIAEGADAAGADPKPTHAIGHGPPGVVADAPSAAHDQVVLPVPVDEVSGTAAIDAAPDVVADTRTVLAPPPLAAPLLDPPTLKSDLLAADTVPVNPQPIVDLSVAGRPETDESGVPAKPSSRWSLRNLLAKLETTGPAPITEFPPPAPPDVTMVPDPDLEPTARRSSTPITSPIPVQPPSTEEALTRVDPETAGSFVQPFGLMPEQPPYIRPTPSFDPGMFRTGPVELDPALDPDVPQRAPRLKPIHVPTAVRRRGRPRMRRVTRVVRHVDPWSVFKVALCFSLVLYGVCLTAGVLLWNVAYTTGTIDNVQRFFESFGWDTFRFKGGELYHNAWIAGLFCAIGLTGLIVLAATLFNLITDLVGGIRVTVLEEEVIERDPAERRTLLRRRSRHTTSSVPSPARRDDDEQSIELYEHLS
jgi:transmembrane protein DUF3566